MIYLILGILIGLSVAIFIAILIGRFSAPIQRGLPIINKQVQEILGKKDSIAYIAGLSEEESTYLESLQEKEVKLI